MSCPRVAVDDILEMRQFLIDNGCIIPFGESDMSCSETPKTLFISDEISGMNDDLFALADTWAKRRIEIVNPVRNGLFYSGANMQANVLVEIVEGLVKAETPTQPPFSVLVPWDTQLDVQYRDGQDDGGTLRERILRIENVKEVLCARAAGVSLAHYEG